MADTGIVCSYCENKKNCFQYEELQEELYTLFLRHRNYPRRALFCVVCIGRGWRKIEHEKRKIQKSKSSSEYSSESIERRSRRDFLDTQSSVGSERQLRDIGNIEGRRPIAANPATHKPNEHASDSSGNIEGRRPIAANPATHKTNEPASDSSGSSNVSESQVINIGESENSYTPAIIEPISTSPEKPRNISTRSRTPENAPKILKSPQPGPSNEGKNAEKRKAAFVVPKSVKRRLTVEGQHVSPREERLLHRQTARLEEERRLAEENERRKKLFLLRQKKEMELKEKQRLEKEKEEEKKRKQRAELEQQRIQKERDEQQKEQAKRLKELEEQQKERATRLKELAEKRKQEQEERARRERAVQQVARRIIVPPDDSDSDDNDSVSTGSLTIAPIPSNRRLRGGTLPTGHIPYTLTEDLNNYPRQNGG